MQHVTCTRMRHTEYVVYDKTHNTEHNGTWTSIDSWLTHAHTHTKQRRKIVSNSHLNRIYAWQNSGKAVFKFAYVDVDVCMCLHRLRPIQIVNKKYLSIHSFFHISCTSPCLFFLSFSHFVYYFFIVCYFQQNVFALVHHAMPFYILNFEFSMVFSHFPSFSSSFAVMFLFDTIICFSRFVRILLRIQR